MSLEHAADLVKQQTLTRDAFLGGRLHVSQPRNGFRAGLDSVLLGASVRHGEGALLDLGAGAGTAALVALAHHPALAATLVEADPQLAELAAANLAANDLAGRAGVLCLDVTSPGAERLAAGLRTDSFGTVIANPPFFDPAAGTSADVLRQAARSMNPATLELWVRAAAASAAPRAEIVFIHTAAALAPLLAAFGTRFGAITVLPLVPREGMPASRILVRGIKGSRAPLTLLASRVLHGAGRDFRPEFDAIFRGDARLDW